MHTRAVALAASLVAVLAACADGTAEDPVPDEAPLTPRAVAAVAVDVLDLDPEAAGGDPSRFEELGQGVIAAQVRLRGDADEPGTLLRVSVSPPLDDPCAVLVTAGCTNSTVDGGTLTVAWQVVEPEEDPGFVFISLRRDDESISVGSYGEEIVGDPRDQDLELSVDDLVKLVADPRLSLVTSQAVVDLGASYEPWGGRT
jgi:hypothetical protein